MGFSLGGHLSVSVASRAVVTRWLEPDQNGFAAHVGFYPACNWLKKNVDSTGSTGTPILIMTGEKDSWKGFAPYAKDKPAVFQWNEEAAHDSRERAIDFLRQAFRMHSIKPAFQKGRTRGLKNTIPSDGICKERGG
jgi:hypothetical protein